MTLIDAKLWFLKAWDWVGFHPKTSLAVGCLIAGVILGLML